MLGIAKHQGTGAWAGGDPVALFNPQFTVTADYWRNYASLFMGYVGNNGSGRQGTWAHQNFDSTDDYTYTGSSLGKFAATYTRFCPTGWHAQFSQDYATGDTIYEGGNFVFQLRNPDGGGYGYFLAGAAHKCASFNTATSTSWLFGFEAANNQSSYYVGDYTGVTYTPAEVENVWTTYQISVSDNKADFAGFTTAASDATSLYVRYRIYNSIIGERIVDRVMSLSVAKSTWLAAGGFGFNKVQDGLTGQLFSLGDTNTHNYGQRHVNCWQLIGHAVDWTAQGSQFHRTNGLPKYIGTKTVTASSGEQLPTTYTSMRYNQNLTWVSDVSGGNPAVANMTPDYTTLTGQAALIKLELYDISSATVTSKIIGDNPYGVV